MIKNKQMQQLTTGEQEILLFEELSDEQCNNLVGGTGTLGLGTDGIVNGGAIDQTVDLPGGLDDLFNGGKLDKGLDTP